MLSAALDGSTLGAMLNGLGGSTLDASLISALSGLIGGSTLESSMLDLALNGLDCVIVDDNIYVFNGRRTPRSTVIMTRPLSEQVMLIRLPAHKGNGRERGYQTIYKTLRTVGHTVTRLHVCGFIPCQQPHMTLAAHMGEGVEYHTVYGVSPWTTRTYLLPYRVCCTVS